MDGGLCQIRHEERVQQRGFRRILGLEVVKDPQSERGRLDQVIWQSKPLDQVGIGARDGLPVQRKGHAGFVGSTQDVIKRLNDLGLKTGPGAERFQLQLQGEWQGPAEA